MRVYIFGFGLIFYCYTWEHYGIVVKNMRYKTNYLNYNPDFFSFIKRRNLGKLLNFSELLIVVWKTKIIRLPIQRIVRSFE